MRSLCPQRKNSLSQWRGQSRFGLKWEREKLMVPLQQIDNKLFAGTMWALGYLVRFACQLLR